MTRIPVAIGTVLVGIAINSGFAIADPCGPLIQSYSDWITHPVGANQISPVYGAYVFQEAGPSSTVPTANSAVAIVEYVDGKSSVNGDGSLSFNGNILINNQTHFAANPRFTAQINVSASGIIKIQKLFDGKPFMRRGPDVVQANCIGHLFVGNNVLNDGSGKGYIVSFEKLQPIAVIH